MTKWTRRADDRPLELAQAALALCAERGVQPTRVADIAERAGVTVGTVYKYFRDKDALVDAALNLAARPARKSNVPDRPGASLPAVADALRRWGAFFRETGTPAIRVALSDPQRDASAVHSPIGEAVAEVAGLIALGVERKEMRSDLDAGAVARALIGGLLLAPVVGGGDGAADAETMSALAMRGLRADGPSWRAPG